LANPSPSRLRTSRIVQGRAAIESFVKEFLQMNPTITFCRLTNGEPAYEHYDEFHRTA
jgi:hypothetical protein